MNNQETIAAKMICRSLEALTREVHLLRMTIEEREINLPPPDIGNRKINFSTGRG